MSRWPVEVLAARLVRLDPVFYAGWTGETFRSWCAENGIEVDAAGQVAHRDLLAAMDRRTAELARRALSD